MRQRCGLYRENKQQASKLKVNAGKGVWEMVDSNDHLLLENSFIYTLISLNWSILIILHMKVPDSGKGLIIPLKCVAKSSSASHCLCISWQIIYLLHLLLTHISKWNNNNNNNLTCTVMSQNMKKIIYLISM